MIPKKPHAHALAHAPDATTSPHSSSLGSTPKGTAGASSAAQGGGGGRLHTSPRSTRGSAAAATTGSAASAILPFLMHAHRLSEKTMRKKKKREGSRLGEPQSPSESSQLTESTDREAAPPPVSDLPPLPDFSKPGRHIHSKRPTQVCLVLSPRIF